MPVLSGYLLFKGMSNALNGTIRGLGKHLYSVIVIIVLYYIISIPLMYFLVVKPKLDLFYLWFAPLGASVLEFFIYLFILLYILDWNKIKDQALLSIYKRKEDFIEERRKMMQV